MASPKLLLEFWIVIIVLSATVSGYDIEGSCGESDTCWTLADFENDNCQKFTSNSKYVLANGNHKVTGDLHLRNLHNVTFIGAGVNQTTVMLGHSAEIDIFNSTIIQFQSMTLINEETNKNLPNNTYLIISSTKHLTISDVNFKKVSPPSNLRFLHIFSNSFVNVNNCTFHNEHNEKGGANGHNEKGGANGHIEKGRAILTYQSTVTFTGQNLFTSNSAKSEAGAIYANNCILTFTGENCFKANKAMKGGAIYANNCTLTFTGENYFKANKAMKGGAIYLQKGLIVLTGRVQFINNTGERGGALYLNGGAQILFKSITNTETVFQSNVNISFEENKAEKMGGAIYVADSKERYVLQCHHLPITKSISCFFKVEEFYNTSIVKFERNYAELGGASIFGGFLEKCRVQDNDILSNVSGHEYIHKIAVFHNCSDETSYISSKALKICLCDNNKPNCSKTGNEIIYPGRTLNISVVPVGQLNLPVSAFISSIFHSDELAEVHPEFYSFSLTSKCHDVGYRVLMSKMKINLTLHPEGCYNPSSSLLVTIKRYPCPPGFELKGNICDCDKNLSDLRVLGKRCITRCDIEKGWIIKSKNIWIKEVSDNSYQCGKCPLGYCNEFNWTDLAESSIDQCRSNRTGTLCGACKDNYSLMLNSLDCSMCENNHLSLLIFFFFAGIALIAVLLLLQMTVAHGTINGLILYCNVVSICYNKFLPPDENILPPLPTFIAWVNLNFGITTCFYDGLDHYTYTWLQFAFPLYLWVLIGLIIAGCKISSRISMLFGSNPVAVLATVILMSFTKLLQTAEQALSFNILINTNSTTDPEKVWEMDSNIPYFKKKHIVLAICSILIISFLLLPYIFLLTFGYHLQKYSGRKRFRWFNCFKPLLDAYYAPYNMKKRYWTGLLLLIRSSLFLCLPLLRESNAVLVTVSSLFSFLLAFSWLNGRIYERFYNELLEASFVLNLCLLGIASYHVRMVQGNQLHVTYVSASIAFTEFLGILFFHIALRIGKKINPNLNLHHTEYINTILHKLKCKKKSDHHRAEVDNQNTLIVRLREPLLDDSIEL